MASIKQAKVGTLVDEGYRLDQEIKSLKKQLDRIKDELKRRYEAGEKYEGENAVVELIMSKKGVVDPTKAFRIMPKELFLSIVSVPVTKARTVLSEVDFERMYVEQPPTVTIRFKKKD